MKVSWIEDLGSHLPEELSWGHDLTEGFVKRSGELISIQKTLWGTLAFVMEENLNMVVSVDADKLRYK